jgi:DNA-binding IclR family transcriptional regulator
MRVVQTLQRGLAILDYLAEAPEPVRATEIAAHFAIDKANASRLLATLQEAGWARRPDGRRYTVGPKYGHDGGRPLERVLALRESTHSLLESLVEMSGECAHLAVLVGDKVWYVDKVPSPQALRVDHAVGTLSPLHCTALGKVFLAFGARPIPKDLTRFTNRTLVEPTALEANLDEARRSGFTRDDEEFSPGVRCAAAPVRHDDGAPVAAVGLSGPSARIDLQQLTDLGRLVRDRCRELTLPAKEKAA